MEVSIDRAQLSQNLNKSLDDLDFTKFLQDHALNHRLAVYFPKKALTYPQSLFHWPLLFIYFGPQSTVIGILNPLFRRQRETITPNSKK